MPKTTILTLKQDQLIAKVYETGNKQALLQNEYSAPLKDSTIKEALLKLKNETNLANIRFLIPQEKAYVGLLKFESKTVLDKETIFKQVSALIPEPLTEGFFDFKQVNLDEENEYALFFAVRPKYYLEFAKVFEEEKIKVEAIETPSIAISRLVTDKTEPFFLLYQEEKTFVIAYFKGIVLGVFSLDNNLDLGAQVTKIALYLKEKFGLEVKKVIKTSFDASLALALKDDLKGNDDKVLNLNPPSDINEEELVEQTSLLDEEKTSQIPEKKISDKEPTPIKLIIYLLLAIISVGIFIYIVMDKINSKKVSNNQQAQLVSENKAQLPVITSSPTPIQAKFKASDYAVQIISTKLTDQEKETMLEDMVLAGYEKVTFEVVKVASSSSSLIIKPKVAEFQDNFLKDFKDLISAQKLEVSLAEDRDYDVVLIIGKEK